MGLLKSIFSWWDGPTWGTRLFTRLHGDEVGTDAGGNRYYRTTGTTGERRWVIYAGLNDASRVPPEWHGWLHRTTDILPDGAAIPAHPWQKPHVPNLTGTVAAWQRRGSLASPGKREAATGDYEAWSPDQS